MLTVENTDSVEPEIEERQPLILAIETATRTGSVAIVRGNEILSSRVGDPEISHSTNLLEMIASALSEANAGLSDVDFFAIAVGPGSFTGLRIGLATVKAFAAMNSKPIVGVATLAAVARAAGTDGKIVSLLPAGRGEVFAQMFSVDSGQVTQMDDARHLTPAETLKRYGQPAGAHWTGEGVAKITGYLESASATIEIETLELETANCIAASVAAVALKDYREGNTVTADELHAVYVRASDAEINERWQQQNAPQSAQV
jgi:tRNA threonylcarbamoyladenosine biosynthesis protein TsaB